MVYRVLISDRDLQNCDWQVGCGQAAAVCCLFQYKTNMSRNETSSGQVENKSRWSVMYQVADLQNSPKAVEGTKKLHRLQRRLSRYLDREVLRVMRET